MISIAGKDISDIVIDDKNVVKIQYANNLNIIWEKVVQPVSTEYFYIENTYDGSNTISLKTTTGSIDKTGNYTTTLQYSKDKETWITITLSGTKTIPMNSGERVYFRNDSSSFNWINPSDSRDSFYTQIKCTNNHKVGGNITTLLNYKDSNVTLSLNCFYELFSNNNYLTDASELILPKSIANSCYDHMFDGCTSLTSAPALPATTLAEYCYRSMFSGCTSLTSAPALPATTLAKYCYRNMFSGCSSLTSAPALPATTLAEYCYMSMFSSCTSLVNAPTLPATSLASNCYRLMFRNCTSLISAPDLPVTTLAKNCYGEMFYGCTSLVNAPTLPATNMETYSYNRMFRDCTSLVNPPELPATSLSQSCYIEMFYGCTSLVNAPTLPATSLVQECYYYMFYNCSSLNNVTSYANDISESEIDDYTFLWLGNVASTGVFHNYGSVTYPRNGSGIPTGWTEVKPDTPDYFYIENTYNGTNTVSVKQTISGSPDSSTYAKSVQFSKNGSDWETITLSSTAYTISLNQGEKVYFRGNEGVFNYWYSGGVKKAITTISASQNHTVGGNINTLLDYIDPYGLTLPQGAFNSMFENDTKLTSASDITLPPSYDGSLSTYCYLYMFKGCSSLTTAPQSIPATIQGQDACNGMFINTAITTAPELPATTLTSSCYWNMFRGCTSLVNAPALPATTVAENCYRNMFYGCSSLVNAPELPATTLAPNCYRSMFNGCTSLTTAPDLLAPTLVTYCYSYMFNACTSLNSVKCTATSGVGLNNSTTEWLWNVSSTGTFTKESGVNWVSGYSGIPTGWTVVTS